MSSTQYTLQLLTEYAYTLDSLPLDLSKHLADLRELDAVLSASISSITTRVNRLVDAIETQDGTISKDEKLWLLDSVAREAKGLRLGSEDKIKVSSQTGDLLSHHQEYLSALLAAAAQTSSDPAFNSDSLFQRTTYPHLPSQPAIVDTSLDTNRRKRAATSRSLLGNGMNGATGNAPGGERERERERERESPVKKRRTAVREDEASTSKSRNGHNSQTHTHPNGRKHIRQPSVDSFISVTSHPQHNTLNAVVDLHGHSTSQVHSQAPSHQPRRTAPTAGMLDSFLGRSDAQQPDDGGENELDDPDRAYCICGTVSWGEMIACDDGNCEREWFHLSCLGLTSAPEGKEKWYCDECTARRAQAANHKRSHKKNQGRMMQGSTQKLWD